jgi:hypothetical protein
LRNNNLRLVASADIKPNSDVSKKVADYSKLFKDSMILVSEYGLYVAKKW